MTFDNFSSKMTQALGSTSAFFIAAGIVVGWAIAGPFFDFSPGWQLFINTGTTIITFLMVFVIQRSQNKDTLALHAKIDELIKASEKASNEYRGIEEKAEEEIRKIKKKGLKL